MSVVALTPGRRVWINALDLPAPTHPMQGFLEVDVTRAIAVCRREHLSFTGFLVACLARAVDENKQVQAYRKGRRQLVVPDDVDVGMLIEHARGLMGHVVRRASHKTVREIHAEIRAVQAAPAPADRGVPAWFRALSLAPWPIPRGPAQRVKRAQAPRGRRAERPGAPPRATRVAAVRPSKRPPRSHRVRGPAAVADANAHEDISDSRPRSAPRATHTRPC